MRSKVLAFSTNSAALAALAWLLLPALPASAGCGCDHPPPGYASIMPAFGSPGKKVRLNAPSGRSFAPGAVYLVKMGNREAFVAATTGSHIDVAVPMDADPGPTEVEIVGDGFDHKYEKREFTVMAPAPMLPERNGLFAARNFQAAVSEDGTVLVPFNLSEVADATQFLVVLRGMPLSFEHDEVVFYNADGVDLTLFTLAVDDPTERQWGSYFGWEVEQERGLFGTVYENRVVRSIFSDLSDQLTYWRHEFHSYKAAHAVGGTHEVDEHGYHKSDGTLHIDHDHLVLSVAGKMRGQNSDRANWDAPSSGTHTVDVFVLMLQTETPLEPEMMVGQALGSLIWSYFSDMEIEGDDAYDDD